MADRPTISLVIPTVSRPTLARALASVRRQDWWPGDEVLLVGDGPQPIARALWEQFHLAGAYIETPRRLGSWGHGARNWVNEYRRATGQYLMALDDDDELTPNAVAIVRAALVGSPGRPHIFRMSNVPNGIGTCWKVKEIRERNVGTPCLVAPNDPALLGEYTPRHGGDYDFIRDTCDYHPDGPVWRTEVICRVRPPRAD